MMRLLTAALAAVLIASPAFAAVTANSYVTPQTPNRGVLQFTSSNTAGTYLTLYTAGTNGSRCNAIWATSNDASASHLVTLQIHNGSASYGGTAVTVPVNAGFAAGTAPVNLLSTANFPGLPLDSNGNPYVLLANGDTLQATFATAITASDVVNLVVSCGDF